MDSTSGDCMKCNASNVISDMVQCDNCQKWAHYTCVGVTDAIKDSAWNCEGCNKKLQVPKPPKKTSSKGSSQKTKSDVGSENETTVSLEASLRKLKEELCAREKALEEEMILQEKRLEMERVLQEKRRQKEKAMMEKQLQQERKLMQRQLEEERELLRKQLEEEAAFMNQRKKLREQFQGAKNALAQNFTDQDGAVGGKPKTESEMSFEKKVQLWLKKQGAVSKLTGLEEEKEIDEDEEEADPEEESEEADPEEEPGEEDQEEEFLLSPEDRELIERILAKSKLHGSGEKPQIPRPQQQAKLSQEQLAARQAMSKNLPIFKGESEKWPMFISCYEFTTAACGFSNLDNLKRLQDCLQGDALEAVRSRLVLPDSVPDVINDLRRIFGRPEKLLKTLLTKVRNAQPPRADRLETFMQFGITVKQLCDHLEASKLGDHLNNPMLVQELVEKLPPNYKMDWVRFKRDKSGAPLRVFTDFMNDIVADASEVSEFSTLFLGEPGQQGKNKPKRKEFLHVHNTVSNKLEAPAPPKGAKPCWVCKRTDHKLRFCDDFKKSSIADRLKVVEQHKLCAQCLNNHGKSRCNFKIRCNVSGCQGNHHPLLHRAEETIQLMDIACNAHSGFNRGVIFRMVPVTLYFQNYAIEILAFLDEGSSTTLVEESVARELEVHGFAEPLIVTWTGNVKRLEDTSKRVNLTISARGSNEKLPLKNVRTVVELKLPKQGMQYDEIGERYPHLNNIPVVSYGLEEPRMIIGLDNLDVFAPIESRIGSSGEPIGVRSKLGWTIYGPRQNAAVISDVSVNFHTLAPMSNQELHDAMRSQYLLEDPASASVAESAEDTRARRIMEETTVRVGNCYETGLLWRQDERRFPDGFPMALARLKCLEKKLSKDAELRAKVHQQIAEYLAKGYAHKATREELAEMAGGNIWYVPLNVVLNPRKPGKVRLVCDARASVNGISLNTELLTGPDLLVPLPSVLCPFREKRVAFGGDIQEMYHQYRIRTADKKYQCFLFRGGPDDSPETYIMDVGTFGATCSPCSAQFIKNLNAARFEHEFPQASAAVIKKHYVDDYYDSVDSEEEAIKIASEVKYIHSQGGFHIRNWVSNSPRFLDAMGEQPKMSAIHFHQDKYTLTERVLGIIWSPEEDVLSFSTATRTEYQDMLQGISRPTKRIVLSSVMSMFDPLGLLSPFTIYGRMLIQDLWRTGCGWDDPIDDESFEKWIRWTKVLPTIEAIKVPRSYFGDAKYGEIQELQLHIITDASKGAYGCAAYFRAVIKGRVQCALVTSRVKVAPLKPMSVPRLELQAAVLGARMAAAVRKNHSYDIHRQFFWTDSTTVLSWITSDLRKYKEYVGLRIGEIHTLTKLCEWRWVPTRLNVADQLTKWTRDPELNSNSQWFTGPEFLYRDEENWPKQKTTQPTTQEELKVHLLVHDIQLPEPVIDVHRISKWSVLVRTVACAFRFVSNCRRKAKGYPIETLKPTDNQAKQIKLMNFPVMRTPLKQIEYEKAEQSLIKLAQVMSFGDEMKILTKNAGVAVEDRLHIEKSSFLYKMTPLIDDKGILRMESRVERAEFLPFDLRFPIVLPKEHAVTVKIVQHYHEKFGHGYRETVKNELRQRFFVQAVGAVLTRVTRDCLWCKINKNRPQTPRMAALPVQRLTPFLRPFSYVGVDYLGPFIVSVGRRCEKRWIVLFTCLVVRSIHLEVAHSLTTQSCLMAIRRFVCRRGPPMEFFSDNGTNLRGASKELVAEVRSIGEECANEFTSSKTKWTFNPPASPHMGGVWERLVRSVKEVLGVIDDGRRLTDEILLTSIAEAEDIINSRPLTTYVSQESNNAEALSPNHFLRGTSPNEPLAAAVPVHPAEALRDSYKRSQQLSGEMWNRWIKEYVPSISQRKKWFRESRNLKAGDLVYIVDGDKRKCWVRGVVEQPIVSGDGRVRQALVRTNSGVLKRAAVKLAVLEISDGEAGSDVDSEPGSRAGVCSDQHRWA